MTRLRCYQFSISGFNLSQPGIILPRFITAVNVVHCFCFLLDLKPSFGQVQRTINICPTGNIKAASHETLRIRLPLGSRQSCSVRVTIPERSWIKFVTNAHSITQSLPGRPCAPGEQAYYIEVTYPGAQTKYYCGSRNSAELVFSRYSRTASQATVTFVIKVPVYLGSSSYYQLLYTG